MWYSVDIVMLVTTSGDIYLIQSFDRRANVSSCILLNYIEDSLLGLILACDPFKKSTSYGCDPLV